MPSGVSQGAAGAGGCAIAGAKSTRAKFGMRVMMPSGSSVTLSLRPGSARVARHHLSGYAVHGDRYRRAISWWTYIMAGCQRRQGGLARPACACGPLPAASFHLQAEPLDEIPELDVVLVQEIRQLLGRARLSLEAAHCQGVLELGIGDDLRNVGAELPDDGWRRTAGYEHREPDADVDAGQSGFRESRHVR